MTTEVHLVATEVACVAGISGYRTSVHVDGQEYHFDDTGVVAGPPLRSHTGGRAPGKNTKVIDFGVSEFDGDVLSRTLGPLFAEGTHDVLRKNCNSFTDAALFLLTGERLPRDFTRGERLLLSMEPISTWVVPHLMFATQLLMDDSRNSRAAQVISMYDCNPAAVDFSMDQVIDSHLREWRERHALSAGHSCDEWQDSTEARKRQDRSSCC